MKLYAGLDLHSNNNVVVIVNERGQVVFRRQANVASGILEGLEPFRRVAQTSFIVRCLRRRDRETGPTL